MRLEIVVRIGALALGVALALPVAAQQVTFMTGPQGGSWIPLGGALKNMWEKAIPGLQIQQTARRRHRQRARHRRGQGADRLRATRRPPSTASTAARRTRRRSTKVCQVANLYPQYFQVVALADAKVNSFADLKGKSLVTQPKGNTAEVLTDDVLKLNGLTYQSLSKVNFQASYTDAVSMMKDGHAQVFTLGTTAPASAVMDLASARDIELVPVDDKTMARAEEDERRLQQAHRSRPAPIRSRTRTSGDRLLDAPRRGLRPARGHGLQDDQGDGDERARHGGGREGDRRA